MVNEMRVLQSGRKFILHMQLTKAYRVKYHAIKLFLLSTYKCTSSQCESSFIKLLGTTGLNGITGWLYNYLYQCAWHCVHASSVAHGITRLGTLWTCTARSASISEPTRALSQHSSQKTCQHLTDVTGSRKES